MLLVGFYIAGAVAVLSTTLALTRLQPIHALLYLVVSLLAVAVVFFTLGAPFVAALEVIVYAGAIMVLFIFVVMLLNLGAHAVEAERLLLPWHAWVGPLALSALLLALVVYVIASGSGMPAQESIGPKEVSRSLFGPYALGVELASLLLTAALVGAYHLGVQQQPKHQGVSDESDSREPGAAAGGDSVRPRAGRAAGAP